jgi:hypothetical protein
MKISILDDYHDTLRALDSFAKLSGHDVEVWNDHVQDVDALAERLRETEARWCSFARRGTLEGRPLSASLKSY